MKVKKAVIKDNFIRKNFAKKELQIRSLKILIRLKTWNLSS